VDRFIEDLRRHLADWMAEDVDSAGSSGAAGTPTVSINGRRHHGAYDIEVREPLECLPSQSTG
jgi:hypothetical protein